MLKLLQTKWFAIAALMLAAPVAYAQVPQEVEAEGQAAVVGTDKAAARDKAIDDALRKAVESAVGTWVSSTSSTVDFQLVEDKILTQSKGYVQTYKILAEKVEDGVFIVKVKATVSVGNLEKDLKSIAAQIERKDKPKILVMVSEQNVGQQPESWWSSAGFNTNMDIVENTFIDLWRPKGFRFVDRQALKGKITVGNAMRSSAVSDTDAKEFASQTDAQVIIVGKAVATSNGPIMNTNMQSIMANISLRAINVGTGEIIATSTTQAAAPHVNVLEGGSRSLRKATEKSAEELLAKILDVWTEETTGPQTIKMTVKVAKSKMLRAFKQAMTDNVRGIQAIRDRGYTDGEAALDVEVKSRLQDVVTELEEKEFPGLKIEVLGYTSSSITLKVE